MVVVAFALFTVAYHAALAFDLRITLTVVAWLVATVIAVIAMRAVPNGDAHGDAHPLEADVEPFPRFAVAAGIVGVGAALVLGTRVLDDARWWLFDIAAVAALLLAGAAILRTRPALGERRSRPALAPIVALVLAGAFALGALLTVRPDADDVLGVNRSVWIEHRGATFPVRDTLFSNQRFSYTRPENPSPSIEPFVGVIARWTPLSAPTVAYLVIAPAVSFLAVLALWRLLRTLRATLPWLALAVAVVFLVYDASLPASFGNFAFGRAWQGKVIFVFLAVPLLWRHALAWSRDGDRRALAMLVATNVGAVGLSTTALFVAPPITVLGVLAGLRRERVAQRLAGMVGALAYPLGAGLFALVAARQPTSIALAAGHLVAQVAHTAPVDVTNGLDSWDPWYFVVGTGATALVAAVATLCGWLGTRDRASRLALVLAPLALFGVFVSPPVLHVLQHASSEGASVLWRVVWIVPVPAMVGVLATGALARYGSRAVVATAVVFAAICVVGGTPVWSHSNGARLVWHPEWDLDPGEAKAAHRLLGMSHKGDVVATPEDARGNIGGTIAVQTVDVRAVDPRGKYLTGRHTRNPAFHANERRLVTRGMTSGIEPSELGAFVASLHLLSVDAACMRPGLERGVPGLGIVQAGFVPAGRDDQCVYWRRKRG
ncbi:MAG: hypothetical protein QOI55_1433 [Actinomycetota bacterium]|nr:hypothetical protein [Actinomycetota bacterium]